MKHSKLSLKTVSTYISVEIMLKMLQLNPLKLIFQRAIFQTLLEILWLFIRRTFSLNQKQEANSIRCYLIWATGLNPGFWPCTVMIYSYCTGAGPELVQESHGKFSTMKKCLHWSETVAGIRTHCFLLCQSREWDCTTFGTMWEGLSVLEIVCNWNPRGSLFTWISIFQQNTFKFLVTYLI